MNKIKIQTKYSLVFVLFVLVACQEKMGGQANVLDTDVSTPANSPISPSPNFSVAPHKIDLGKCSGSALFDRWAYFAPTGPNYPIPAHDGYRQVAKLYFKGELSAAKSALNTNSFDPKFTLHWRGSDAQHKLYLDYIPSTYVDMCFENKKNLEKTLRKLSEFSKNLDLKNKTLKDIKRIDFRAKLLAWEIQTYLAEHGGDISQFRQIINNIDAYPLFAGIDISDTKEKKLAPDHLRLLSLKARIMSKAAILKNDQESYNEALALFKLVENGISQYKQRRQSASSVIDRSVFTWLHYTKSSNLLHWMDSIQTQIEERPEWLENTSWVLDDREKRLTRSLKLPGANTCQVLVQKQEHALDNSKPICSSKEDIAFVIQKLKVLQFTNLSIQLSSELLYEDSPLLWAQHQHIRYKFYRTYVLQNQDKFHPLRTEEFCLARRALENTLQVVPLARHDADVLEWC